MTTQQRSLRNSPQYCCATSVFQLHEVNAIDINNWLLTGIQQSSLTVKDIEKAPLLFQLQLINESDICIIDFWLTPREQLLRKIPFSTTVEANLYCRAKICILRFDALEAPKSLTLRCLLQKSRQRIFWKNIRYMNPTYEHACLLIFAG